MVWSLRDAPSQEGRRAVVTGGTGGLGFHVALGLAQKGARVVIASRDAEKGASAVRRIRQSGAPGEATFSRLDLADLSSVQRCAEELLEAGDPMDLLVNNAGVMSPHGRTTTRDGFETQFGVNYLGHFALTARVTPLLRRGASPRVVNVASLAHRFAPLDFGDLQSVRYESTRAYGRSKLAMIAFTHEFERRSESGGWGVRALAAHPGWAATELAAPRSGGPTNLSSRVIRALSPVFGQAAQDGALPILFAATAADATPGGYYGPGGLAEMRGPTRPAKLASFASDLDAEARLWEISESLSGITFES